MAERGGSVVVCGSPKDVRVFHGGGEDIWIRVGGEQAKVPVLELREAIEYVMGDMLAAREGVA